MFDFENLKVYSKSKEFNCEIVDFLKKHYLDKTIQYQLQRASFSIMLNIAEGSGRSSNRDKRRFYVIARGSTFECVAIFDFAHETNQISSLSYKQFYSLLEEISKMLFGMIKSLE